MRYSRGCMKRVAVTAVAAILTALIATLFLLRFEPSRLLLTAGDRRVYVIPGSALALAVMPDGLFDFVATLPDDLVWLTLEQTAKGTLAVGLARNGVTRVDVEAAGIQHAALLRQNGFLVDLPGFRAKQITSVLVTTKDGRFRLPLDRKEFTR